MFDLLLELIIEVFHLVHQTRLYLFCPATVWYVRVFVTVLNLRLTNCRLPSKFENHTYFCLAGKMLSEGCFYELTFKIKVLFSGYEHRRSYPLSCFAASTANGGQCIPYIYNKLNLERTQQ